MSKPRIRVPAGSSSQSRQIAIQRPPMTASYLRDSRSGIINTRAAYLRESRDDIRQAWRRSAGIAVDLIQNSGRLRGAADQVIADTVGVELVLSPRPNLARLGWSETEVADWIKLVKEEWKRWSWNPRECDLRGKFTIPQLVDIALRWDMAYGEATGVMSYMSAATRRQYGIRSGTKLCMVPPHRLVQDTSEFEGLYQGIFHDANGRPTHYRFEERNAGILQKRDYPAIDAEGRPVVIHAFDPMDATDVRGISRMAPAFRQHIQHEVLVDTTIQTQILQTIFAATLTSASPSKEAFEALEALPDDQSELRDEFLAYFGGALERARDGDITVSGDPRISHLAPGEEFMLHGAKTPGPQFLPVWQALSRDMARAIGITYGGLTMDHSNATYSSTRMENASIWPVVVRRRERIAGPICQSTYENWLDESVGEGRIPFKGGYTAFAANRDLACWALWQGPAKPSADDGKSAKASTERIQNGTSTLAAECGELGYDHDEVFEERKREHQRYVDAGMPSPFVARNSGGADAAATEDQTTKAAA
ncbi:phage portal protein [Mesorhizobium sp. M5C.F.Ca.IN.020.14.1.1]|nr:phage portal protein [Mesorhizobium sp. M5C.F.Ca.IN.020.14.1.1]